MIVDLVSPSEGEEETVAASFSTAVSNADDSAIVLSGSDAEQAPPPGALPRADAAAIAPPAANHGSSPRESQASDASSHSSMSSLRASLEPRRTGKVGQRSMATAAAGAAQLPAASRKRTAARKQQDADERKRVRAQAREDKLRAKSETRTLRLRETATARISRGDFIDKEMVVHGESGMLRGSFGSFLQDRMDARALDEERALEFEPARSLPPSCPSGLVLFSRRELLVCDELAPPDTDEPRQIPKLAVSCEPGVGQFLSFGMLVMSGSGFVSSLRLHGQAGWVAGLRGRTDRALGWRGSARMPRRLRGKWVPPLRCS
jgi:hypothetical protein